MDACSQAVHVTNQAVIYDLTCAARARITTIYMTTYFTGGALGTTAGAMAYNRYGWDGACTAAACFCGIALLGWLATRRHECPAPQPAPATRLPQAARPLWLCQACTPIPCVPSGVGRPRAKKPPFPVQASLAAAAMRRPSGTNALRLERG